MALVHFNFGWSKLFLSVSFNGNSPAFKRMEITGILDHPFPPNFGEYVLTWVELMDVTFLLLPLSPLGKIKNSISWLRGKWGAGQEKKGLSQQLR